MTFKKLKDIITPDDDYDDYEEMTSDKRGFDKTKAAKANMANVKLVMFQPRTYDDSREIARHLCAGKACIVNMGKIQGDVAQRVLDVLSGVIYATRGSMHKLDICSYLYSPSDMGVAGDIDIDNIKF